MSTIIQISFDEADIPDGIVSSISKDGFAVRFLNPAEVFSPDVAIGSGRRAVRNAAQSTAVEPSRAPMLMEFAPPITRLKLRVGLTDEEHEQSGVRATLKLFDADGAEVASVVHEFVSGPAPVTAALEVRPFGEDVIHRAQLTYDGPQPEVIDDLELQSSATTAVSKSIAHVAAADIARIFGLPGDEVTAEKASDITLADTTGAAIVHSRYAEAGEGATEGAGFVTYTYRVDLSAVRADASDRGLTAIAIDGGLIEPLNYANPGDNLKEDLFVIADGGPGSVGPSSADQLAFTVTFRFDPPLRYGGPDRTGESSFFFGWAHFFPGAGDVWATITDTEGRQDRVAVLGQA